MISRKEAAEVRKSIIHSYFDYIILLIKQKNKTTNNNNRVTNKFLVVNRHMTHGKVMLNTN